jgi:hypothetical protein
MSKTILDKKIKKYNIKVGEWENIMLQ